MGFATSPHLRPINILIAKQLLVDDCNNDMLSNKTYS
jgi:hypothetical protein